MERRPQDTCNYYSHWDISLIESHIAAKMAPLIKAYKNKMDHKIRASLNPKRQFSGRNQNETVTRICNVLEIYFSLKI